MIRVVFSDIFNGDQYYDVGLLCSIPITMQGILT